MWTLRLSVCVLVIAVITGCGRPQATPKTYQPMAHALLVGKVDCITSGWFSDGKTRAKLDLYKINPNGGRQFMTQLTSDYTVVALEPGVYGLDKSHLEIKSGLKYIDYRISYSGAPNHTRLFQDNFWGMTEVEQSAALVNIAPDFLGVIKVDAGEVIYYGDITIDTVTTRDSVMFLEARNPTAATAAVSARYPGGASSIKNKSWVGPAFLLGKVRESRFSGK